MELNRQKTDLDKHQKNTQRTGNLGNLFKNLDIKEGPKGEVIESKKDRKEKAAS